MTDDRLIVALDVPNALAGHEMAARIGNEVRRLDGVLHSFLELASPVGYSREEVDLTELTTEVQDLLETEAESKGVRLGPVQGSATATVDREAIRRALINLVRNAIQASPPEGRVVIVISDGFQEAEIRITDEGAGVDPKIAGQVFDPFVTGRDSGTGLGLALVRRVIEEHEGSVTLDSHHTRGAVAVVHLPSAS